MKIDEKDSKVSIGQFVQELVKKYQNKPYNQDIIEKSISGQGEEVAADGGVLVNYDIVREIIASAQQGSVLYAKAKKIACPKYGISIPFVNETSRKNDSAVGLRAYFVGEGEEKTISHARFDSRSFKLQKLVIRIPATWEILEDVDALTSFLTSFAGEKIAWYIDRAILYGTTKIEGIYSISANGVIGAAVADPLNLASLINMEKALAPANHAKAEYFMSKENYNDILDLIDDTNTSRYITFADGNTYIFSHKVNILEQMNATEGDIILGDFSSYVVTETEFKKNISIGFRYNYNEEELLMEVRFSGCSFGNVYTLEDDTEVAPFVIAEGTGPTVSSSSSESSSSNSSESSGSSNSSSSKSSASTDSSESSESSEEHSESSDSSTSVSESTDSSESSESSEQHSESSTSSSEQHSESSSSSSQSQLGDCPKYLCASQFATNTLNGDYAFSGYHNSKPTYVNGNQVKIWYDSVTGYWAMSDDVGDPVISWLSATDTATDCPDDDIWVNESGIVVAGPCN